MWVKAVLTYMYMYDLYDMYNLLSFKPIWKYFEIPFLFLISIVVEASVQ